MARLLFLVAHSTDDPDRAATALEAAAQAAEAHEVALWLSGEGVRLAVSGVDDALREPGHRPASESLAVLDEGGAAVFVSEPCFRKRKFEEDALREGAALVEPHRLARLVAEGWIPITP